jgi:hypothetical protein
MKIFSPFLGIFLGRHMFRRFVFLIIFFTIFFSSSLLPMEQENKYGDKDIVLFGHGFGAPKKQVKKYFIFNKKYLVKTKSFISKKLENFRVLPIFYKKIPKINLSAGHI